MRGRRPSGTKPITKIKIVFSLLALLLGIAARLEAQSPPAHDPGVRGGSADAGGPIAGLTAAELAFFNAGQDAFLEVDSVSGTIPNTGSGLGPLFNLASCGGCHAPPAPGGPSPFTNPQVAVANKAGATNTIPFFVTLNGPVREARFKRNPDGTPDGGVHDLFTITGRSDAPGCNIAQPDFNTAAAQNWRGSAFTDSVAVRTGQSVAGPRRNASAVTMNSSPNE